MLTLSDASWRQLLELLATSPARVERVAYLDGIRLAGGDGVVTTATVPQAQQSAGHFTVTADEMSRAGKHLRNHGLVRLAQVHTHPGLDVDHSIIDDTCAYSRKQGAISIVLPRHAAGDPLPTEGAVHVHDGQQWHRLSPVDAAAFVKLVPAVVDTRHPRPVAERRDETEPTNPASSTGRRTSWWTAAWARVTRRR